jgi:hypothetical protein
MTDTKPTPRVRERKYFVYHLELIKEPTDGCHGKTIEYVIVAYLEQQARFTAADNLSDEQRHFWLDPRWTRVTLLGKAEPHFDKNTIITEVKCGE